jgi:hypothetical protein
MKLCTLLFAFGLSTLSLLGLVNLGFHNPNSSALAPGLLFLLPLLGLLAVAWKNMPHPRRPSLAKEAQTFLHVLLHTTAIFLLAFMAVLLIDNENSQPYAITLLSLPLVALLAVTFLKGPKHDPLGKILAKKVSQPL